MTENYAQYSNFGINFEAFLGDQRIVCEISTEALQDIDPSNSQAPVEEQFLSNQYSFQLIAEEMILDDNFSVSKILITSADVVNA